MNVAITVGILFPIFSSIEGRRDAVYTMKPGAHCDCVKVPFSNSSSLGFVLRDTPPNGVAVGGAQAYVTVADLHLYQIDYTDSELVPSPLSSKDRRGGER